LSIEKLIIRNNDCVNAIKYAYGMVAYEYLPPKEARARRVAYARPWYRIVLETEMNKFK